MCRRVQVTELYRLYTFPKLVLEHYQSLEVELDNRQQTPHSPRNLLLEGIPFSAMVFSTSGGCATM